MLLQDEVEKLFVIQQEQEKFLRVKLCLLYVKVSFKDSVQRFVAGAASVKRSVDPCFLPVSKL